jgi:hypothetical protein
VRDGELPLPLGSWACCPNTVSMTCCAGIRSSWRSSFADFQVFTVDYVEAELRSGKRLSGTLTRHAASVLRSASSGLTVCAPTTSRGPRQPSRTATSTDLANWDKALRRRAV